MAADVATLTLRADISELQRKLRSIPGDADGQAKQMAVSLERAFKRAEKASTDAARNSTAAQLKAVAATERAAERLKDYAAAGDKSAQMALAFERQKKEIAQLAEVTGDTESAQVALNKVTKDYEDSVKGVDATGPLEDHADAAGKSAGEQFRLNQQVQSFRKNVADVFQSLNSGQNPFTVLSQQGPQLTEILAETKDQVELLRESFGGMISKIGAYGPVVAAAVVATAALYTAFITVKNQTEQLNPALTQLRGQIEGAYAAADLGAESAANMAAALRTLKQGVNDTGDDLAVLVGTMNQYDLALKRTIISIDEKTKADVLAAGSAVAATQYALSQAKAMYASRDASIEERAEASQRVKTYEAQLKVQRVALGEAKASAEQMRENAATEAEYRKELDESNAFLERRAAAEKSAKDAGERRTKTLDEQAAALDKIRGIAEATEAASASAERKLGMAASKQITELNAIAAKYAEQPEIIAAAADAEDAVRNELQNKLNELRVQQDTEAEANRTAAIRRETDARMSAEQKIHDKRMTNASNFNQASMDFTTGVADLMNVVAKETAKRDKELAMRQFKVAKAAGMAQALINGAVAITRALASLGPILGPVAATGIAATTAAQVATIAAQKPAFDRGGMIQGGEQMADQVTINALPGEAVLSRQAVRAVGGQSGVDAINRGSAPGQNVVMVPVYKHFGRFVQDELQRSSVLQGAMMAGRQVGALGYSR
jgi:hypothetical protein